MDDLKKFIAVKFTTKNEYAIVPRSWLVLGKKQLYCLWPKAEDLSNLGAADVTELARKSEPPLDGWAKFKCQRVAMSSRSRLN